MKNAAWLFLMLACLWYQSAVCFADESAEWTQEVITVKNRIGMVSGDIVYEGTEEELVIPEKAVIKVWDEESGQEFEALLPVIEVKKIGERWEDFSFALIVHAYGSDQYRLGDMEIHQEEIYALPKTHETMLLEQIGLNSADARCLTGTWEGDAYLNEGGELCRVFRVSAQRRLITMNAVYGGEHPLPDYNQEREQSSDGEQEEASPASADISHSVTEELGEIPKSDINSKMTALKRILKVCLKITLSVFAILAAVLGFRILVLLARKWDFHRKKEKRDK